MEKELHSTPNNFVRKQVNKIRYQTMLYIAVFCLCCDDLMYSELEGQLSFLPNFTNSAKIFHIIKYFNLNVKTIFKSSSFQNLLQLMVLHIKSTHKYTQPESL